MHQWGGYSVGTCGARRPSDKPCGRHLRITPLEDRGTGHYPPASTPHWWKVAPENWAAPHFQSTLVYSWRVGSRQKKAFPQRRWAAGAGGRRLFVCWKLSSTAAGGLGLAGEYGTGQLLFTYSHLALLKYASKVLDQVALGKNCNSGPLLVMLPRPDLTSSGLKSVKCRW